MRNISEMTIDYDNVHNFSSDLGVDYDASYKSSIFNTDDDKSREEINFIIKLQEYFDEDTISDIYLYMYHENLDPKLIWIAICELPTHGRADGLGSSRI